MAAPGGGRDVVDVTPAARPVVFNREHVKTTDTEVQNKLRSLEICAGSGGLSLALWKQGFEATGIDWQGNRHATKIPSSCEI